LTINNKKAYTYFKNRFDLKKTSQNWWSFDNPFDPEGEGRRKMAVHFSYEVVKCWRTGYKQDIINFVMDYENISIYNAYKLIESQTDSNIDLNLLDKVTFSSINSNISLPDGFNSILSGDGILGKRARKYLVGRGFDLKTLSNLGFGYVNSEDSEYFGYIIIPFKIKGLLTYYIGRDFIGNFLRYKNPSKQSIGIGKGDLFYNEDALSLYDTVFLTEGWADALTIGKQGIASMGWYLSNTQKDKILFSKIKRLVMIPDIGHEKNTSFYQKAANIAFDFLNNKEVYLVDLRPCEKYGKDVNEIGLERVKQLIAETKPLTFKEATSIIIK
jgi:DNA primase